MKQTSIEWFGHEVYKAIELHAEGKISATILGINIAEARHKAIEIYKTETASNCSQPVTDNHALEISDEETEKEASRFLYKEHREYFKMGIKWYREKLKNADKKS
jgi:hypothetical protein